MSAAAVLFDLDGVLLDSREPITSCMNDALARNGFAPRPAAELVPLVGPPIAVAFAQLTGHARESPVVTACVAAYREVYAVVSIREARSFDGVPEAVAQLADGYPLAVATSKPTVFAEPLLEATKLRERFAVVAGPDLATVAESKAQTIERALVELGGPRRAVMIGDRHFDVAGAQANALPVIGVTWGLGTREELVQAGATVIVDAPGQLADAATALLACG